jgi:23S rRNA (pseudouridine1915-N3)-methyltransferase
VKLEFVFVGGDKTPWLESFVAEYATKLSRHYTTQVTRLKPKGLSRDQADAKRKIETEQILAALKPNDWVVVFDERGRVLNSLQLASRLENWLNRGRSRLVFVVGGAFGFDERLRSRADEVVSLSSFVLNHHVAEAVALEQIYRAVSINKNLPYHNED